MNTGEHVRAFPLSDWTELDVWQYIERESMALPDIYFAHDREVVLRDGMYLAVGPFVEPRESETVERRTVRFRTVGDANCTGAVLSLASTLSAIIEEVALANVSERGATRADDKFSETAMEDRKREGVLLSMQLATKDLLRLATIGSVDDGKSTLIGRLLVDTRQLFDDQLDAIAEASEKRGVGDLDLSFITDGLRAEREQGITIDVAYRYATTPTRKFIIADCPGHVQYTSNMATGASTADLALVVLDVASGLKEQTRRHLCIAALLGVRSIIVAVNKMDAVDWSQLAFDRVVDEIVTLSRELDFTSVSLIPVSALLGDNVVESSNNLPWYDGPTVLAALESSEAGAWEHTTTQGARLPIQWVLRQPGAGRTYAGMVNGDTLHVGDRVTLLPANVETTIASLNFGGDAITDATVGLAADVGLAAETNAGRGDLIATAPLPTVSNELKTTICWFGEKPLVVGQRLRLKHTSKVTPVRVKIINGVIDIAKLDIDDSTTLNTNDIGLATLQTADLLVVDDYRVNRVTGSFVLIDEVTNATVAAGMVGHASFL